MDEHYTFNNSMLRKDSCTLAAALRYLHARTQYLIFTLVSLKRVHVIGLAAECRRLAHLQTLHNAKSASYTLSRVEACLTSAYGKRQVSDRCLRIVPISPMRLSSSAQRLSYHQTRCIRIIHVHAVFSVPR